MNRIYHYHLRPFTHKKTNVLPILILFDDWFNSLDGGYIGFPLVGTVSFRDIHHRVDGLCHWTAHIVLLLSKNWMAIVDWIFQRMLLCLMEAHSRGTWMHAPAWRSCNFIEFFWLLASAGRFYSPVRMKCLSHKKVVSLRAHVTQFVLSNLYTNHKWSRAHLFFVE